MGKEESRRTRASAELRGCRQCGRTHSVRPGRGAYEVQVVGRCSWCKLPFYETQVVEPEEYK